MVILFLKQGFYTFQLTYYVPGSGVINAVEEVGCHVAKDKSCGDRDHQLEDHDQVAVDFLHWKQNRCDCLAGTRC